MVRPLQTYKGLWQKTLNVPSEREPPVAPEGKPFIANAPDLLWQNLVADRRELGGQLLFHPEIHASRGSHLLRSSKPWQEWAHQRMFSLTCLLNIQVPEEAWRRVQRPWRYAHYRSTCRVLIKLLDLYAGSAPLGWRGRFLRCLWYWPPAFVWHYERLLVHVRAGRPKVIVVGANEAVV